MRSIWQRERSRHGCKKMIGGEREPASICIYMHVMYMYARGQGKRRADSLKAPACRNWGRGQAELSSVPASPPAPLKSFSRYQPPIFNAEALLGQLAAQHGWSR